MPLQWTHSKWSNKLYCILQNPETKTIKSQHKHINCSQISLLLIVANAGWSLAIQVWLTSQVHHSIKEQSHCWFTGCEIRYGYKVWSQKNTLLQFNKWSWVTTYFERFGTNPVSFVNYYRWTPDRPGTAHHSHFSLSRRYHSTDRAHYSIWSLMGSQNQTAGRILKEKQSITSLNTR